MGMSNQQLLERASAAFEKMGVQKAENVITTENAGTGQFMNREQVEHLVDLTVSENGWLSAVSVKLRNQRSGQIPRMNLSKKVTEGVPENGGRTIATVPDFDHVAYRAKKFQATWFVTLEDIREARASGTADFDESVRVAFAKAMGNDMADVALNGDTELPASSRDFRLLRHIDGWLKQLREKALRYTTTRGTAYARSLFTAMQAKMPRKYRNDKDLRWLMSSDIDLAWTDKLRDSSASGGSRLGDDALITRRYFEPHGIPQLIVPQMPADQGFDTLSGQTADPDNIADNTTHLTAEVDNLFGGFNATHVGRQIRITYEPTGDYEVCTVVSDGSSLEIVTSGMLGQDSIDTTAANYTLDFADCTSVVLTNPKNLFLVMTDSIRAYRRWEQEFERFRMDVFYEMDAGVFNEDAAVIQDGIVPPTFTFGD